MHLLNDEIAKIVYADHLDMYKARLLLIENENEIYQPEITSLKMMIVLLTNLLDDK